MPLGGHFYTAANTRKLHIGIDMLRPCEYEHFSLQPIMSMIHRYLVIYVIRFHKMSRLTLFIPLELMTPSIAVRSL